MDIGLFVPLGKRQRLGGDPPLLGTGGRGPGLRVDLGPRARGAVRRLRVAVPVRRRWPVSRRWGHRPPRAAHRLTYLAAVTNRIRLGTGICLVPQRNPVYTAKQVVDLDCLSGGQVDFGIGVGWLREEFEAVAVPFARRGAHRRVPAGDAFALDRRGLVIRRRALHAAGVPHVPQAGPATAPTRSTSGARALRRCGERHGTATAGTRSTGCPTISTTHSTGSTQCSPRRAAAERRRAHGVAVPHPVDAAAIEAYRARGVDRLVVLCLAFDVDGLRTQLDHLVFTVLEPSLA